jgi:hypothetical protein
VNELFVSDEYKKKEEELKANIINFLDSEPKDMNIRMKLEKSLYDYYHSFSLCYKQSEVVRFVLKNFILLMDLLDNDPGKIDWILIEEILDTWNKYHEKVSHLD